MPQPYHCPKCSRRVFTVTKLIQHIGLIHAHEPNFQISCGINDCCSSFKIFESFRRHIYRKHFHSNSDKNCAEEDLDVTESIDEDADSGREDLNENLSPAAKPVPSIEELLKDFKNNLFNFIIKCREKNLLPISVQKEIVEDVNFLFCFFKENYDAFLTFHLEKNGFNISEIPELARVLHSDDFFRGATGAIQSPYCITEHCKNALQMTEPIDYKLLDDKGKVIGSCSYVPVHKVLKRYFSNDDIKDFVFPNHTPQTDFLSDYCDGNIFAEHSFFRDHPNALRLHFYEDEFEVVNPLGAKRNKHKLCGFYYTIGNLDKKYTSLQQHIHLALLVRYSFVKKCSWDIILKPLLDDLKRLASHGFTVTVDQKEHTIFAGLATLSCDNLSAHMLGGFKMSFNSGRICRYCMATHKDIKQMFREEDFLLRTLDIHRQHLQRVELCPDDKATYGVNGPSPFTDLDYFDTTTAFPPDVMHDVLEGVIPLVLKLVIGKAHTEKHITIREINDELKRLCIGQNDKNNRPVQLSERLHVVGITGSASQKWCLFRLLPFVLAHRVPLNCEYWKVFLLCREIAEIVMAPKVNKNTLLLLNGLVEDFLTKMKNVFGDVITPKCHYLIHYARLMEMYGPLRLLWCMRFESKHQYFKKIAFTSRNFINISTTLSKRHQFRQCWEFSSGKMFADFEHVPGKSIETPLVSLPAGLQKALTTDHQFCQRDFTKPMQRVSQVTVNSVKYAVHDAFIIGLLHAERVPLFLKIKYIMNFDTEWVLCGKLLYPLQFKHHFFAYSVKMDDEWILMRPGDEVDKQAYDVYSVDDEMFISIRHCI